MTDLFDRYTPDTRIDCVEYSEPGQGLFETYGQDLQTVLAIAANHPQRVWTLVDTDYGGTAWINGYHYVNRILYAVTVEDGQPDEIFSVLEDDSDEWEDEQ
jgi:hypothetical protein